MDTFNILLTMLRLMMSISIDNQKVNKSSYDIDKKKI
jgi:hypothetical protein